MQEIDKGEEFPLTTGKQLKSFKFIVKQLRRSPQDKGKLVKKLENQEIYKNRNDCKKFLQNCIKSCNHEIVSLSTRKVGLPTQEKKVEIDGKKK